MEPLADFMDPLIDSPCGFHGTRYRLRGSLQIPLIDFMDPLIDCMHQLIDFMYPLKDSPL